MPAPPGHDADLEFSCPRCSAAVRAHYYGPCHRCLGELRVVFTATRREVDEVVYEPKMNVTPNAVALKDD